MKLQAKSRLLAAGPGEAMEALVRDAYNYVQSLGLKTSNRSPDALTYRIAFKVNMTLEAAEQVLERHFGKPERVYEDPIKHYISRTWDTDRAQGRSITLKKVRGNLQVVLLQLSARKT